MILVFQAQYLVRFKALIANVTLYSVAFLDVSLDDDTFLDSANDMSGNVMEGKYIYSGTDPSRRGHNTNNLTTKDMAPTTQMIHV